jgi:hypothetical protein
MIAAAILSSMPAGIHQSLRRTQQHVGIRAHRAHSTRAVAGLELFDFGSDRLDYTCAFHAERKWRQLYRVEPLR